MNVHSLNHFKSVTAHRFFVVPADNDYLIARWMRLGHFPEFFWHACQAIEKYLKASLILNGLQLKKGTHNLSSLFQDYCDVYGGLALTTFEKPQDLDTRFWQQEKVSSFISKLDHLGPPDSRYGLVSWHFSGDYLFKLDQICWSLRRMTIGLDWTIGADFPATGEMASYQGKPFRDALTQDVSASVRGSIDNLKKSIPDMGATRADLLHTWNFEFQRCPADIFKAAPGLTISQFGPAVNSYLYLYWEALTAKDKDGNLRPLEPNFRQGMEWLIKTIKLPKDVTLEIQSMLQTKR
ncbi:HEPN domain-containing protein [Leisingera sp. HS039]|uniref:HEPN domain-containing protein n=1 Tax=unclassified Leisingera TaxID=2614906 RepID=UPI001070A2C9|nr:MULTISPECIES: HEPN domain-containing protein [unclassified Leisingera]MBQ4826681.1 HEPN domain-containing protein [Leisingera sp. HS039]QBR37125.1 HEPN domain-containing protein [Leisingera sp. NJS201]